MRLMTIPTYLGTLFLSMSFLASITYTQPLPAQAAGTSVSVRMIEAVDSGKDPAGKQYRASVTKALAAGNGVMIPQGAVAAVTLVNSGNGWTTQLVSVTVNGQPVPVTSSPASAASAPQNAASTAVTAVNSMLGSFGHHVKPSAGVTAVAMGQHVILPPGTTLTFALSQPLAPGSGSPGAPASPGSQPAIASAAPAPTGASGSVIAAAGQEWWMCQYKDVKDRLKPELGNIRYYALFSSSETLAGGPHGMDIHFNAYVPQNYKINDPNKAGGYCDRISNDAPGREYSMNLLLKQWTSSNDEPIHVSWTDTPAENAAIEARTKSADTALVAAGPVLGANQSYAICYSDPDAPVVYLSEVFASSAPVNTGHCGNCAAQRNAEYANSTTFQAFLKKKYGSSSAASCAQGFMPSAAGLNAAQNRKQSVEDTAKRNKAQIIETGWKNTP